MSIAINFSIIKEENAFEEFPYIHNLNKNFVTIYTHNNGRALIGIVKIFFILTDLRLTIQILGSTEKEGRKSLLIYASSIKPAFL